MTNRFRIYLVTFNEYTNAMEDTVWDGENYLDIPSEGLLIKEENIYKFIGFGKGFKKMKSVGILVE